MFRKVRKSPRTWGVKPVFFFLNSRLTCSQKKGFFFKKQRAWWVCFPQCGPDVLFLAVASSLLGAIVQEENIVCLEIVGTAIPFRATEPSLSF